MAAASFCAASVLFGVPLAAPLAHAGNRHALQEIVQEHCVIDWISHHDPAPCVEVVLPDPAKADTGYAVLADRKGGAHFLLIPTRTIPGIESPLLFERGAPNYFAFAWQARSHLADVVGHEVPRGAVGLAVNPPSARSQDQLHIHIECLDPRIVQALDEESERLGTAWTTVRIGIVHFRARRLMGERLELNPFELLAHDIPDAGRTPGDYTLLLAGRQFPDGPGFVLFAGTGLGAEFLLDSSCAVAERPA